MAPSPPPLRDGVLAALGASSPRFVRHSWQADVWRAVLVDGTNVAIKRHHSRASFTREHTAYQTLPSSLRARAPRLLGADFDAQVLAVTWLEGNCASQLGHIALPRAHEGAGAWCRELSQSGAIHDDPLPYATALQRRVDGCLRRTDGLITAAVATQVQHAIDPTAFASVNRTWAHRDFAPYNWIWGDHGLAVYDFGQSRPDYWLWDLTRLVPIWRGRLELRAAFFEGFGRALDPLERTQLHALTVLDAIATIAWAHEHEEPELAKIGQQRLFGALGP